MQLRVIRPRAGMKAGDVVEVPDGAGFSDLYYEPAAGPAPAAAAAPAIDLTSKAGA